MTGPMAYGRAVAAIARAIPSDSGAVDNVSPYNTSTLALASAAAWAS